MEKKKKNPIGAFYQTVGAQKEWAWIPNYPVQKSLKIHHFIKDLIVIVK